MTSPLTKAQRDELRRRLEAERDRILGVLRDAPIPSADDRESEIEEAAQREAEREQDLGVMERERSLLADVERALGKLDRGDYGVSEETGEPIPYRRLLLVPWARHGVEE